MTLRLWALQSVIIRLLASSKVHPAPWFSWAWLWKEIYTQNVLIESDFNLSKSSKSAPALANSPMGYTEEIHPCIVPAVLLFDSTRGSWNSIDPKKAFARLAQQFGMQDISWGKINGMETNLRNTGPQNRGSPRQWSVVPHQRKDHWWPFLTADFVG